MRCTRRWAFPVCPLTVFGSKGVSYTPVKSGAFVLPPFVFGASLTALSTRDGKGRRPPVLSASPRGPVFLLCTLLCSRLYERKRGERYPRNFILWHSEVSCLCVYFFLAFFVVLLFRLFSCFAQVLTLLARRRLPELASHFDEIDFSVDMVGFLAICDVCGGGGGGGLNRGHPNCCARTSIFAQCAKMALVVACVADPPLSLSLYLSRSLTCCV